MLLKIKNLDFYYKDGSNELRTIFKNANFGFEKGKFYTIIGQSGSGKTTLLSLLGTLDKPKAGSIYYKGVDIFDDPEAYRKRKIGFVFQNYNLINYLSAVENVELAMDIAKVKKDRKHALDILEMVGIDAKKAKRVVTKLSGGEQQRVALARALANNPKIILADEATGNLDIMTANTVLEIFQYLAHEKGKCIIMVTHNLEIAKLSDVVYEIDVQTHQIIEKDKSIL